MLHFMKAMGLGLSLSVFASAAHAGMISVSASGTLPASSFSSGTELWSFSGSFSDDLTDVFASPGGTFEFEPSDLATLDFSIDGTSIAFLTPTPSLLDSRIVLGSESVSFSLFLDPSDPFFGGSLSNVVFSISIASGGPYATDLEDLTTLSVIDNAVASTGLGYRPTGGSFISTSGSGNLSLSPVPLPASGFLLLAALGLLPVFRRLAARIA